MENQLSLRIKKQYFEAIVNGQKTWEFRQDNEHYNKIFLKDGKIKNLDVLKIYYNDVFAIVEILEIRRTANPIPEEDRLPYLRTDVIWALRLGKVLWVNEFVQENKLYENVANIMDMVEEMIEMGESTC